MNAPAFTDLPGYAGRLDARKLQRGLRHYNPSILRVPGRRADHLLCAYRVQGADGISRIGLALLDEKLQVKSDSALVIPGADGPKTHVEDPRLLRVGGQLVLFVCQVDYGATYYFKQRAFTLDAATLQPAAEIPLAFGRNGQGVTEKNWMPFEHAALGLCFVHSVQGEFTVYEHATGRKHTSPGMKRWRWGTISGRTPAVRLGDRYLCLIGGHMPHARRRRLYWFGVATFAAEPPFTLLEVSREPLVWGSEFNPALVNPYDLAWNPLCVFPAGLDVGKDGILVSIGTNDSFCEFLRFTAEQLAGGLVDPASLTGDEKLLATEIPADALNCEQVKVRVICNHPIGEPGGPYVKGDEFICPRHRALALGKMVEVLS